MLAGTIRAGPAFIALVVEVRPGDLIPSLGSNLVPCGEILKYQPIVFNTKVIERQYLRKKCLSDQVSPADQGLGDCRFRFCTRILTGMYHGSNFFIRERHHLLGGPEFIARQTVLESSVWIVWFPTVRIEGLTRKIPSRSFPGIIDARIPWHIKAQSCELDKTGHPVQEKIMAQAWIFGVQAVAAQAGAKINQVMLDKPAARFIHHNVETVQRFRIG